MSGLAEKAEPSPAQDKISAWRQVWDNAGVTPHVQRATYAGSGSEDDPFAVVWLGNDPRNPMQYSSRARWTYVMIVAACALLVSIDSSAYSGSAEEIMQEFGCSKEVFTLGLSLFVLGFAVGPIIWGPLSEVFGRRAVFIPTYICLTVFNAGAAGAQSIGALLALRFLGGAVGSNSLISAGAVVADQFPPRERGLALAYYAVTPFLGPTLGPIIGGFVAAGAGWRWVEGVMAISTGILCVLYILTVPETYGPKLLECRARKLMEMTGDVYKSQLEIKQGRKKLSQVMKIALSRPWILLFREPIVTVLAVYQAIIYATLYLCFAAFPIVYQKKRGWSPGIGGLAFLGVMVGMLFTVPYNIWTNKRYAKLSDAHHGFAPPEARLPLCMAGAVTAPTGLFWFAWTNSPSLPWAISIIAGAPFGFALVVVFQGINNYLVDSYTIFAASVLAGTAILRSLMAAAFPLFVDSMYEKIGIHWGSSVPAFLSLAFAPAPFLLYKYGGRIRERCKYSAEAIAYFKQLHGERAGSGGAAKVDGSRPASREEDVCSVASVENLAADRRAEELDIEKQDSADGRADDGKDHE